MILSEEESRPIDRAIHGVICIAAQALGFPLKVRLESPDGLVASMTIAYAGAVPTVVPLQDVPEYVCFPLMVVCTGNGQRFVGEIPEPVWESGGNA